MFSDLAKFVDMENKYKMMNYCKDCEFYEGTCTKKVSIIICEKEKIKVKKSK